MLFVWFYSFPNFIKCFVVAAKAFKIFAIYGGLIIGGASIAAICAGFFGCGINS